MKKRFAIAIIKSTIQHQNIFFSFKIIDSDKHDCLKYEWSANNQIKSSITKHMILTVDLKT